MRRPQVLTATVPIAIALVACVPPDDDEDAADDDFLVDGKADGGIGEGSPEAIGVLRVANESSRGVFRHEVRLGERSIDGLIAHRAGPDAIDGTIDDDRFDTLAELDRAPYVGPLAFTKLLAYARAHDLVPGSGQDARFDLNDVSILFPLPASAAERGAFLWLVPRTGEQGPFFPASLIDQLPALNGDVPDTLGYPSAMVTAFRFDPCFPRLGGASCQAQIRLVAQPVIVTATGVSMLDDAAVHLFYRLDDAASREVARALVALRAMSSAPTSGPLRVHPGLGGPGSSPFAAALRALVVARCREDNLIRITTNSFAFDVWSFAKFEYATGALERQALQHTTTPATSQAWIRQAFTDSLDDPSGTIDPRPTRGFEYLLSIANFGNGAPADPAAARQAADAVLRIENPRESSTDDVDCVSCHLATQARLFASRNGVSFEPAAWQPPAGHDTSLVLAPELQGNLGATIAFGWHTNHQGRHTPSISQRVINESAEIAEYLTRVGAADL